MPNSTQNQHPSFPARTVMKIITDVNEHDEQVTIERLDTVFRELLLEPAEWRRTYSKKNSYVSFTTEVLIQNRDQLHILYEKLGELPEVRYIL
jgi:putative lipoic acid-binding regulatory protein